MNRIPLVSSQFDKKDFRIIDQRQIEHMKEVLKVQKNDSVKLCLVDKGLALGKITEIKNDSISGEILELTTTKTKSNIRLIVGACRPPTAKKILEHATTMGINHFTFIKCELAEKSYLHSTLFQSEKFQKYLLLGLAQSGKFYKLPKVEVINQKEIVGSSINLICSFNTENIVLDYIDKTFNFDNDITIAIGPERGWTDKEESFFVLEKKFNPIKIANTILRIEHAVFTILAQIELIRLKNSK